MTCSCLFESVQNLSSSVSKWMTNFTCYLGTKVVGGVLRFHRKLTGNVIRKFSRSFRGSFKLFLDVFWVGKRSKTLRCTRSLPVPGISVPGSRSASRVRACVCCWCCGGRRVLLSWWVTDRIPSAWKRIRNDTVTTHRSTSCPFVISRFSCAHYAVRPGTGPNTPRIDGTPARTYLSGIRVGCRGVLVNPLGAEERDRAAAAGRRRRGRRALGPGGGVHALLGNHRELFHTLITITGTGLPLTTVLGCLR